MTTARLIAAWVVGLFILTVLVLVTWGYAWHDVIRGRRNRRMYQELAARRAARAAAGANDDDTDAVRKAA